VAPGAYDHAGLLKTMHLGVEHDETSALVTTEITVEICVTRDTKRIGRWRV
jgi:hypothetical protein